MKHTRILNSNMVHKRTYRLNVTYAGFRKRFYYLDGTCFKCWKWNHFFRAANFGRNLAVRGGVVGMLVVLSGNLVAAA